MVRSDVRSIAVVLGAIAVCIGLIRYWSIPGEEVQRLLGEEGLKNSAACGPPPPGLWELAGRGAYAAVFGRTPRQQQQKSPTPPPSPEPVPAPPSSSPKPPASSSFYSFVSRSPPQQKTGEDPPPERGSFFQASLLAPVYWVAYAAYEEPRKALASTTKVVGVFAAAAGGSLLALVCVLVLPGLFRTVRSWGRGGALPPATTPTPSPPARETVSPPALPQRSSLPPSPRENVKLLIEKAKTERYTDILRGIERVEAERKDAGDAGSPLKSLDELKVQIQRIVDEMEDSRAYIETLSAERDSALSQVTRWREERVGGAGASSSHSPAFALSDIPALRTKLETSEKEVQDLKEQAKHWYIKHETTHAAVKELGEEKEGLELSVRQLRAQVAEKEEEMERSVKDLRAQLAGKEEVQEKVVRELQAQLGEERVEMERSVQALQAQLVGKEDALEKTVNELQMKMGEEQEEMERSIRALRAQLAEKEDAQEKAVKELRAQVAEKEEELERSARVLKAQIMEKEEELERTLQDFRAKASLEEREGLFNKIEYLEKSKAAEARTAAALQEQVNTLEADSERARKRLEAEIASVTAAGAVTQQQLRDSQESVLSLQKSREFDQKKMEALEKDLKLKAEASRLDARKAETDGKIAREKLERLQREIESTKAELQAALARESVLQEEMSQLSKANERLKSETRYLKDEVTEREAASREAMEEVNRLRDKAADLQDLDRVRKDRQQLERSLAETSLLLQRAEEREAALEQRLAVLQKEAAGAQHLDERCAELAKQVDVLQQRGLQAEEEATRLRGVEVAYNAMSEKYTTAAAKLREQETTAKTEEQVNSELERRLREAGTEQSKLKMELWGREAEIERQARDVGELERALRATAEQLEEEKCMSRDVNVELKKLTQRLNVLQQNSPASHRAGSRRSPSVGSLSPAHVSVQRTLVMESLTPPHSAR